LKSPDTTSPLLSVSWTNDSNRLAVGDQQGQVIIWDVQAGAQRYKHIAGNGGPYVWGLAWSPDGSRIASSGQYHGQNSVEVWDAALGNTLVRYTGHLGDVNSIAWSPDSKYVASGSLDTTVQVWQP
jgi:WD40 repeat protein